MTPRKEVRYLDGWKKCPFCGDGAEADDLDWLGMRMVINCCGRFNWNYPDRTLGTFVFYGAPCDDQDQLQ